MTMERCVPNNPDKLQKVVVTRFSFIGNSGWKIPVEDREKILFEPARLDLRLRLFERITLASLHAQTDQGFHHYVLTSDQLPDWALIRLTALCQTTYPDGRFTIDRQPIGNARKYLRNFMLREKIGDKVVQIVLDDDDGLASDFMATVAAKLTAAAADGSFDTDKLPFFLSFSRGYGLIFSQVADQPPQVFLHRYPYINLGLTMVNHANVTNILAINHLTTPKNAGCEPINGAPMFVRSVHAFNDSRVAQSERWKPVPGGLADPTLMGRFAYLANLMSDG